MTATTFSLCIPEYKTIEVVEFRIILGFMCVLIYYDLQRKYSIQTQWDILVHGMIGQYPQAGLVDMRVMYIGEGNGREQCWCINSVLEA